LSNKLKSMPFVSIGNEKVAEQLKNKPITKIIVDILDGDLWSSKVSFFGNLVIIFLIITSSLEVVLSSDASLNIYVKYFQVIYFITSVIFSFEIFFRIYFAHFINPKRNKANSVFAYLFSFYGLVDILSILPFIFSLFGINTLQVLKIIRIFRTWRIARYIPAFSSISSAFKSKRDEILVSLLGVSLLSLTLSAFIYYAELRVGTNDFKSITEVFVWSLGKYTGDYGAIAGATPITFVGKFLATINGLLGIALFALPAGLLGSAFIDSLSDLKRKKEIDERIALIENYFEQSISGKNSFVGKKAFARFFVFDTIQARFLLSDNEILESIRASNNLRYRAMKSLPTLRYNDTKLIERFLHNTTYGSKINTNKNVYIINPSGASERCISHFTFTIASNLNYNYISRENRLYCGSEEIGSNYSKFYKAYINETNKNFPIAFVDFMKDISTINKEDIVVIIKSAASGRADFILEYGNIKGVSIIENGMSTIHSQEIAQDLENNMRELSESILIKTDKATNEEFSFSIENHSIGNNDEKWIGQNVYNITRANVFTLYVNINILIGEDERYYAGMNLIYQTLERTFK
jgi:voltage-gated potassium channel